MWIATQVLDGDASGRLTSKGLCEAIKKLVCPPRMFELVFHALSLWPWTCNLCFNLTPHRNQREGNIAI